MNDLALAAYRSIDRLDPRLWFAAIRGICFELMKTDFCDPRRFFYELQTEVIAELDVYWDAQAQALEDQMEREAHDEDHYAALTEMSHDVDD